MGSATDVLPRGLWFRVTTVARVFGVSRSTIYRWIEEGRLPAAKPSPGTIRISRVAVEKLLEEF